MKKYILYILLISILSGHFLKRYVGYNKEIKNLEKLKIEKMELMNKEKGLIKKEVNVENLDSLVIKEESEFLKKIYKEMKKNNLRLLKNSSSLIKEENEKYKLEYIEFKIEGLLVDFYAFLHAIYFSNIYIDTNYTSIEINSETININLGYILKKGEEI